MKWKSCRYSTTSGALVRFRVRMALRIALSMSFHANAGPLGPFKLSAMRVLGTRGPQLSSQFAQPYVRQPLRIDVDRCQEDAAFRSASGDLGEVCEDLPLQRPIIVQPGDRSLGPIDVWKPLGRRAPKRPDVSVWLVVDETIFVPLRLLDRVHVHDAKGLAKEDEIRKVNGSKAERTSSQR